MRVLAILLVLGFLPGSAAAQTDAVALINAELHPVSGPVIARGTLVMQHGRIVAVGAGVRAPVGARVIDVAGARVLPGFIDAYCHLGLREIELSQPTVDVHEGSGPVQPHLRVQDALDLRGLSVARASAAGVTTVHSVPLAANVVGGVSAVWRTQRGALLPEVALAPEAMMHVGFGESPRAYGKRHLAPMTRMGTVALLREAFAKASALEDALARAKKADTAPPARDLASEALLRVARKELPLLVRAERADDILVALRVAEELGARLVIGGGAEAWRVAAALKARDVAVIVAPVRVAPDRMERAGARLDNAALLHAAGVRIAFGTKESPMVSGLALDAGVARSRGLPPEAALRALTLGAAELLGVAREVGSLEVGKRADVVVVRGDPMEPRSPVEAVYIGGLPVDVRPWERP